jgi:FAD:protein FMN transferase
MRSLAVPAVPAESSKPGLTTYTSSDVAMDTLIALRVDTMRPAAEVQAALGRALRWFGEVEAVCSRFDPASELVNLAHHTGSARRVSPLLFQAVAFAVEVARLTGGAFDPTIGAVQERRGFDTNYISGRGTASAPHSAEPVSYRDVLADRTAGAILLRRPLLLDLGAVAKGLAIDLAAKELATFERYAIDAGGDIYAGVTSGSAAAWRVGIRNPVDESALIETVQLRNAAACTSGGYERPATGAGEHHLLDPRTGRSPNRLSSVTVVAPTAMVADALATAAFVLGPSKGLRLLHGQGVGGLLVTATGGIRMTPGFKEQLA